MPKQSKRPPSRELVQLRAALALNLRAHMAAKYGRQEPQTTAAIKVGDATGLGKNTVLRALGKGADEVDIRLDTLVRLAQHFEVTPLDLLQDYSIPTAPRTRPKPRSMARDQSKDADVDRAELRRGRGT